MTDKEEQDDSREEKIKELMRVSGYTRAEAEEAVAIELGESDGDVIEEPGDQDEHG